MAINYKYSLGDSISGERIIGWAVPTAFDPKYRYNEHQKYQPGIFEIAFQWILSMLVIWRIWL